MDKQSDIRRILALLVAQAPTGYAIALHIRYTTPTYLFQTYPKAWIDHYSQNGLVMRDPTVHWGFDNVGTARWSDLAATDTAGIIALAATHGMKHGFTCAHETDGSRSLSSFTRADGDFSDAEIAGIADELATLHRLTSASDPLTGETRDWLRQLSITFSHP